MTTKKKPIPYYKQAQQERKAAQPSRRERARAINGENHKFHPAYWNKNSCWSCGQHQYTLMHELPQVRLV